MAYARNDICVLHRVVGNLEPIGATLLDVDGTKIDLTGLTIRFRMVNTADGSVTVNNTTATIVTATDATVSFAPTSDHMATAGTYAMYWIDDAVVDRLWPYDGARFLLKLKAETEAV